MKKQKEDRTAFFRTWHADISEGTCASRSCPHIVAIAVESSEQTPSHRAQKASLWQEGGPRAHRCLMLRLQQRRRHRSHLRPLPRPQPHHSCRRRQRQQQQHRSSWLQQLLRPHFLNMVAASCSALVPTHGTRAPSLQSSVFVLPTLRRMEDGSIKHKKHRHSFPSTCNRQGMAGATRSGSRAPLTKPAAVETHHKGVEEAFVTL